jgi:hypothetical protein
LAQLLDFPTNQALDLGLRSGVRPGGSVPEGLKCASLSLDENDSSLIETRSINRRPWIHRLAHSRCAGRGAGYEVVLYDNLSNSKLSVLDRLRSHELFCQKALSI